MPKMAQNIFNSVKMTRPDRNQFDLSHDVKLTLDMGELIPIMVQECVPGDSYSISCDSLLRFAPLISPVMHRMDVSMHYFFVPNRLVWDKFGDWIMGNVEISHPLMGLPSTPPGSLADYMGIGQRFGNQNVNPIPFAAYQMIYNEYYRDQNLVAEVDYKLPPGFFSAASLPQFIVKRRRAWQHDYFTGALPFAQKGPTVDIPLGQVSDRPIKWNPGGGPSSVVVQTESVPGGTAFDVPVVGQITDNPTEVPANAFYAQAGEVGATTINDFRRAERLQRWLERNARAGTRYIEGILAHFGVKSSDARLQRPEYITGTKSPVIVSEVLNTTGQDTLDPESPGLPQGNMAGHALSVTSGKYGKYYCEEHGFIIGIMSVMPVPAYQQGTPRHFCKRSDRFDYYWPEFANIGEQEILQKEIYANSSNPDDVFGYVPRYAEYKYTPSRVAGNFKDNLDFWHLGRIFDVTTEETEPKLNQQFIECNPGKRIFAVTESNVNSLYCQVLNKVRATRPMPKYGTPTL